MRTADTGRIVVVASIAAKVGEPTSRPTRQANMACSGWSGPQPPSSPATGVTVNAVCPGYVDTPMTDATVAGIVARTGRSEEQARGSPDGQAADRPAGHARGGRGRRVALRRRTPRERAGHQRRRRGCAVVTLERVNPAELRRPRASPMPSSRRAASCSWPGRPLSTGRAHRRRRRRRAVRAGARQPAGSADRAPAGGPTSWPASRSTSSTSTTTRRTPRAIGRCGGDSSASDYPAMAAIGVTRLWDAEALVEVQGIAVL